MNKILKLLIPIGLCLLGSFLWISCSGKIDRRSVVDRHTIITTTFDDKSPAQVGNGEFAFGMDITGLQTFAQFYTSAQWSWHSVPVPEGVNISDYQPLIWDTHGRPVPYEMPDGKHSQATRWLASNPHRFNLGQIGFILTKSDGQPASVEDLTNITQKTDLWTGIVMSHFELEGIPVDVKTYCHGEKDAIGVEVESELISNGRLQVKFSYLYPQGYGYDRFGYNQPELHTTTLEKTGENTAIFQRTMDDAEYNVTLQWEGKAELVEDSTHFFRLSHSGGEKLQFAALFTKGKDSQTPLSSSQCYKSSVASWDNFWNSGAAIDLSESTDERWKELERRIVLSQYVMKVNEAGSLPPQESGLVNNSGWYGRFHFEMIWWHGVHYALWDRWDLFDRSLHVYADFLPTSKQRAEKQGYKGARWPKCTADFDREWPDTIHSTLIWQQPHPIYFAELDYRLHPEKATLDKWKDVVLESAEFMADYAFFDQNKGSYVLGPPVYIVSENTNWKTTTNPTYELSYWRFGLRTAQLWRERLGMERSPKWDDVLNKLSPLPVEDGVYITSEGLENMWTRYNFEHPALIGTYGMLPGDGVDVETLKKTLEKIYSSWNLERTWGWDFPMLAMASARTGDGEKAIEMLLYPTKAFGFDDHGLSSGGPYPYFPSNGALLTAVAMMANGWDGSQGDAPGFPKDGKWVVKHEGFNTMP